MLMKLKKSNNNNNYLKLLEDFLKRESVLYRPGAPENPQNDRRVHNDRNVRDVQKTLRCSYSYFTMVISYSNPLASLFNSIPGTCKTKTTN